MTWIIDRDIVLSRLIINWLFKNFELKFLSFTNFYTIELVKNLYEFNKQMSIEFKNDNIFS